MTDQEEEKPRLIKVTLIIDADGRDAKELLDYCTNDYKDFYPLEYIGDIVGGLVDAHSFEDVPDEVAKKLYPEWWAEANRPDEPDDEDEYEEPVYVKAQAERNSWAKIPALHPDIVNEMTACDYKAYTTLYGKSEEAINKKIKELYEKYKPCYKK